MNKLEVALPSSLQMLSKSKKKPEMTVIGGCLRGLCSYLTNFSQSVAEGRLASYPGRMAGEKCFFPNLWPGRGDKGPSPFLGRVVCFTMQGMNPDIGCAPFFYRTEIESQ